MALAVPDLRALQARRQDARQTHFGLLFHCAWAPSPTLGSPTGLQQQK